MAKAVFQRNQRVWVDSVGAWASVERIDAIWAKGFDEPLRVTYDVGLAGRSRRTNCEPRTSPAIRPRTRRRRPAGG